MKNDSDPVKALEAEIVLPGGAVAGLDSLNLRITMQIAPRSWVRSLQQLIESTEQGQSLAEAIGSHAPKLPAELYALLQSGLKLPEPARFLLDATVTRRNAQEVRWQLITLVAFPLMMLVFAAIICFVVSSTLYILMTEGLADFGLTGFDRALGYVQDQRMGLLAMMAILCWCIVVGLTLRWVGPRWANVAVLGGLPLYGKPLRWIHLYELIERLAIASRQTRDTVGSTEAMAASFVDSSNGKVANLVARRIKAGVSTGAALSQSMLSDGLCAPLLLSIDHESNLAVGCERVAKALRRITDTRCKFLTMMLPVFVIITVGTMIWGTLSGYVAIMIMMIQMITSLT